MRRSSRLAQRTTTTVANNIATISSDTIPDHPKKCKAPLKKKQRVILPLVVQKLPKEGMYPV